MREHGWIEGQHFALHQAWAAGKPDRFPDLAAEIVRSNATVIVAWSTPAVVAAKQATNTVPIVMASSGDAVGAGLVASLSRPGGNVTGVSLLTSELTRKHAELLRKVLPRISRIGVLFDPTSAADTLALREIQATARSLGLWDEGREARSRADIESALSELRKKGVDALVILAGGVNWVNRRRIVELALIHRLPVIYTTSEFAKEGGLISYGVSLLELTRLAADYVDKILRGSRPADLPVEQPRKFELIINLKTAKALGLTISPTLLLRADLVIE
jgi:putative ABC transport system substrate-binding protein